MKAPSDLVRAMLAQRLSAQSSRWLQEAAGEIAALAASSDPAFPTRIAEASRRIPRGALEPTDPERALAGELVPGWDPARWSLLDAARAVLVLSRTDLHRPSAPAAIEDCFRYADVGELVALYRTLALLPQPHAYLWRAGEGCRSNMRAVFEAAACDTPYPFHHFDDTAWRQLAIKALFVGAPLWRVHGLDQRLDAELARIALDLADERRSAGRRVPPELWLCLGADPGERGLGSLERELGGEWAPGRRAALIAFARAGRLERLSAARAREKDPAVLRTLDLCLKGWIHQGAWQDLHGAQ